MAAYAGVVNGVPATIFNAAGVSPARLRDHGRSPEDALRPGPDGSPLVEAYVVEGDIINNEALALAPAVHGRAAAPSH